MVTLGCARNEVDSEELAGRLEAGGFRLVDDPADAETVVVNTCGFVEAAKKDSVDTLLAAADLKESGRRDAGGGGRRLPGRAVRRGAGRPRCRRPTPSSASTTTPTSPARLRSILAGEAQHPHTPAGPAPAAADLPGRAGRRRGLPAAATARRRPAPAAPARRRPDGAAEAGVAAATGAAPSARSRPSAAPSCPGARPTSWPRRAGWPSRARASCSWSRRTPRPTARTSATCGCSRRCCPSSPRSTGVDRVRVSYLQPAETRPGLVDGDRLDAGRGAVLRPVLPARRPTRCCAGCAASATPSRSSGCSTRRAPQAPAGGRPLELHRRLPRRDRGGPRGALRLPDEARLDAIGVFGYSDEDGTEAEAFDGQARRGRDRRAGRARDGAGRGAHRPAGRGAHRRDGRGARGVGRGRPDGSWRAAPPTRGRRSTARPCSRAAGLGAGR